MTKPVDRATLYNALYLAAVELAHPPLGAASLDMARRAAKRYPRRAMACYGAILRSHGIYPVKEPKCPMT